MKETFVKSTLKYALLLAGLTSLPAMAHIGYGGRDFGSFTGTSAASSTITNQAVTGLHGWIDGTDADWGDSHRLRAYRFHLDNDADVKIAFQEQAFVTSAGASVAAGILPGFSVYRGLAHTAPFAADYDFATGSVAIRDAVGGVGLTEGSFRSLTDWSITNDNTDPASAFTYVGHAYDGSVDYGTGVIAGGDGLADHFVSGVFHLTAGDYSIFVGGTDYFSSATPFPSLGVTGVVSVVPEPETYAMLLAGLGLIGFSASRRRKL
ncbi:FxDxF family PEP-CTERM protein [Nitrosomonas sp. Is35]|uniref:FxDxF family PEP-CTERM protein n=1 Tax=unclassified Nitrosomonas TaxID=2609265 RepID=UPI00294B6E1C|nr:MULTISPECIES: FxDxF family PEP-CTERM protein [unclassified Nitrosomonas]MDV6341239.1 FxDxF family PEP-CTERM protein [Nitrosomonas sp. Is24]MDV6347620.1 FxDxF family PEP-CTERM protein [Nitrosomonas sp. Is35]